MRYSEYFVKAAELSSTDSAAAGLLIREAEHHSLPSVPEHLILCARVWMEYLHDRDNALRCLYWNECRVQKNDMRAFCDLTEAYLFLVQDCDSARRCFEKAKALAKDEEYIQVWQNNLKERLQVKKIREISLDGYERFFLEIENA